VIRRWVVALAVTAGAAVPAAAHPASGAPPPAQASTTTEFLPRYTFHLAAEHLSSDDRQFVWDTNFGGELDLVDYVSGRATFVANYQAILGEQFRRFDPNQGNYILGGSLSFRPQGFEVAAVFHHESRHLSDRIKRQAVDWNMLGARLTATRTRGRVELQGRADIRGVVEKSFVDYRWEIDTDARARLPITSMAAVFGGGGVRVLGVDGTRNRGTQRGFRGEGGVRLQGRGAAIELFVAGEQRIDPYPLDFSNERWLSAGFRLLSR
jgi:hypothetical protein